MQSKTITLASILAVALTGAAFAQDKPAKKGYAKPVTIQLKNSQGRSIGTAVMTTSATGVAFKLNLKNLPPGGDHAITLHEDGLCDAPEFRSAGDQLRTPAATDTGAGAMVELNDITVDKNGTVRTTVTLPDASLHDMLVADNGSALIIHAGSDAATDGSDRIACGVIPGSAAKPKM